MSHTLLAQVEVLTLLLIPPPHPFLFSQLVLFCYWTINGVGGALFMPFFYILACDFAVFVIKINRHQLITTVIILMFHTYNIITFKQRRGGGGSSRYIMITWGGGGVESILICMT